MWNQVWDVLSVVCTIVGALTLWALATAAVGSWVLRHRPGVAEAPSDTATAAAADGEAVIETAHPVPVSEPKAQRARSWSQVPSWVKHDKEWAAAVVLLGSDAIAEQTTPFVDFPARRIDWLGLRLEAAQWPPRDRMLVEVAYDLAYGQHGGAAGVVPHLPVTVADLVKDLDHPDLDLVHTAVNLRRGA